MAAFVFFLGCLACCGSIVIYSLLLGISPMPSSKKAKEAILKLLPKKMAGETIYELGSGWGGLALKLAKLHPDARVVAYERSPIPYFVSIARKHLLRRNNLTILRKNFFGQNLTDAKAVVCYLFPKAMRQLSRKLQKELPENCTVISNLFALEGWESGESFYLDDWGATPIYRYRPKSSCSKVSRPLH